MGSLYNIEKLSQPKQTKYPLRDKAVFHDPHFVIRTDKDVQDFSHEGYRKVHFQSKPFCTGSMYTGEIDYLGFTGIGVYKYPHGAIYEGEFRNGEFHGTGILTYPQGQKVEGTWVRGKLVKSQFKPIGTGEEEFKPREYLKFPKRTKATEVDAEEKIKHKEEELADTGHTIPAGCFDTTDGYFDPKEYVVYSYETEKKRIVTEDERKLIETTFKEEADNNVGYLPGIYEYWSSGRSGEVDEMKDEFFKIAQNDSITEPLPTYINI